MNLRPVTPEALPRGVPTEAEIEAVARRLAALEAPMFGDVPPWRGYWARAERMLIEARALRSSGVAL